MEEFALRVEIVVEFLGVGVGAKRGRGEGPDALTPVLNIPNSAVVEGLRLLLEVFGLSGANLLS